MADHIGGSPLLHKLYLFPPAPDHKCTHHTTGAGRGLRNYPLHLPHLIDRNTEVLRDEEAYSTLHDKFVAKPGPEPSNTRLFPVSYQLNWASVLGYSQGKKQCCGEMVINFKAKSNFHQLLSSWGVAESSYSPSQSIQPCSHSKDSIQLYMAFISRARIVNKKSALSLIGTSFVKQNGRVT